MATTSKSVSLLGDSLSLLASLPAESIDVCISDPPYNMSRKKGLAWAFSKHVTMQESWDIFNDDDYLKFSCAWLDQVRRVLKPNGNLFVFGTYHNIYTLGFALQRMDWRVLNSIIWVKPNAQPNITCRMLTESSEQIIWACNNSRKKASGWTFHYAESKKMNGGKQLRNVWPMPLTPRKERVAGHPSQKPEALIENLLRIASHPKDVVLDPFAGVGTTGIAAARLNRRFILMEKEPKYFDAQKARFAAAGLAENVNFQAGTPRKQRGKRGADKPLIETAPGG